MSRQAFDARFPGEEACGQYLADRRWPEGFICPACEGRKGWPLKRKRATWECAGCGRQTSVMAGTVMHGSHLPLRTWFLAAHIVTSHSNGMAALQLQAQLGLGGYKTASPSSLGPCMDGSRGARAFQLKLACFRLRPCIRRLDCSTVAARPDESPRSLWSQSMARAARRSGPNRVSLAIFPSFAIISRCTCLLVEGNTPCLCQATVPALNSVWFFISAQAVRAMRLAKAIAACFGFLRWMIFHSQSSPGSPRRRALTCAMAPR